MSSDRGETLVETLAAILVCSFAILMLFTATSVATRMNSEAYDREIDIQRQHVPAERHQTPTDPSADDLLGEESTKEMSFGGKTYVMRLYGGDDLRSYDLLSEVEG
jgi:hypothetical protein